MEDIIFMIKTLIDEGSSLSVNSIPKSEEEREKLLRALMNVREPQKISKKFLSIQDKYLKNKILEKGIVDIDSLTSLEKIASLDIENANKMYLWKGDITSIKADAIVNAANKKLLGCRLPLHYCIDNAIHTFAGVQLRNECYDIMLSQGFDEPTGKAKITKGYNLPSKYVIHTVGPIVDAKVEDKDKKLLSSCYYESLKIAEKNMLESIVFCSISTGEFKFPKDLAARIAIGTVNDFLNRSKYIKKVIFNVFSNEDYYNYTNIIRMGINEKK
ncbi:protein-ADP-ribose hydrolase [Miniphocaeibacter massiliensis]|uniref:protein-ADP-ribose hydrolase n=1 Tax=Miniphocaeibacter massiliensis TaxID=2041841 RepID=UPI000C1BA01A|nr:protein-ADP-ribose hydrolase [Miniphocaeibacter massiliensis]